MLCGDPEPRDGSGGDLESVPFILELKASQKLGDAEKNVIKSRRPRQL